MIPEDKSKIFEVLQFNDKHRSWFINNTVCSNGKLYVVSKLDPLFIFIQYLEQSCKTNAKPITQVFIDDAEIFLDLFKKEQMNLVIYYYQKLWMSYLLINNLN